jgi:ribosome-associated toxin RatA of RatAB toxin-antitoxin module
MTQASRRATRSSRTGARDASVEGPFRSLAGIWTFSALGDSGCKIGLALDFEYSGRLMAPVMRAGFEKLADRMVDEFCREAARVYG